MAHFFFKLIPPRSTFPADATLAEAQLMQQHVAYWRGLMKTGNVVAFGPVADPKGSFGIGILRLHQGMDAQRLANNDPVVAAGLGFQCEVHPMPSLILEEKKRRISSSMLRSRWNAGCMLLYLAGLSLWFLFKLFELVMSWLDDDLGALKSSPDTIALVAAWVLLGPFAIAVFIRLRSQGWKRPPGVFPFWWAGLKSGVVFLLFTLPYLLMQGALKYSTEKGLIEADSRVKAMFQLFIWTSCVMVLPFWCLMLLRRLPRTSAGKSLVEPLLHAGIVDAREKDLLSS